MGLRIETLKGQTMPGPGKAATERIYRTVDGKLVREGDPRGAFLAYAIGAVVPTGEVDEYDALIDGRADKAAAAYQDAGARDELRRRQSGEPDARPAVNRTPELMHDQLATQLADEARVLANKPPEVLQEIADEAKADRVHATRRVMRTDDGTLVADGDPAGVTVAYTEGQVIEDADLDAYGQLAGNDEQDNDPDGGDADGGDADGKQVKPPANKAVKAAANK